MADTNGYVPPTNAVEAAKILIGSLPWVVPNGQGQFHLGYYRDKKDGTGVEAVPVPFSPRLAQAMGTIDGIIAGRICVGSLRTFDALEASIVNALEAALEKDGEHAALMAIGAQENPQPAGELAETAPGTTSLEKNQFYYRKLANGIHTASSFGLFSDLTPLQAHQPEKIRPGFHTAALEKPATTATHRT